MLEYNKEKEIKNLIKKGFDLELLSFELDVPIEQLQEYKKRLELRQFAKKSIKNNKIVAEKQQEEENSEETTKLNYEETIKKYKAEIASNPQGSQGKRNLLAFAYFMDGRIDEARDELRALVKETSNYMAYRQLIHIEKKEENFEDAKLLAYEALDKFPDSISIREQLISIAKAEKDENEVIKQLKDIIGINPENEKNRKRLKSIMEREER